MQKTTVQLDPTAVSAAAKPALRADEMAELAIFWSFVAGLAWCPFWYGSNDPLAWGVNAILFPGLAFALEALVLLSGRRHAIGIKTVRIPAVLFIVVLGWVFLQTATWMPASLDQPIWALAADTLNRSIDGSISADRDLTSLALMRLVTAASAFWLALQLCRDVTRSRQLVSAIAIIVCIYAIYGMATAAFAPDTILGVPNQNPHGTVSATFINRNSFATYAGLGFLAVSGILLRLYRHMVARAGGSARLRLVSFIETTGRAGAVVIAGTIVVAAALLMSGSRGGIVATAVAFFVLIVLTFKRNSRRANEQRDTVLFVVFVAAATFIAFGDQFLGKIASGDLGQSRVAVYNITIGSIMDSPILGYGYGTFPDIFPMFRDQSISVIGRWVQAHNTYLEIAQGLGVIFGALLVGCVAVPLLRCLKGAMTRVENASIPALAASAGALVGLHSLIDFSMQIQAVTLTFMALLGAGLAQSESSRVSVID